MIAEHLAAIVLTLGRASILDVLAGLIAAGSFAILVFTKVEPTFMVLCAGVAGALIYE